MKMKKELSFYRSQHFYYYHNFQTKTFQLSTEYNKDISKDFAKHFDTVYATHLIYKVDFKTRKELNYNLKNFWQIYNLPSQNFKHVYTVWNINNKYSLKREVLSKKWTASYLNNYLNKKFNEKENPFKDDLYFNEDKVSIIASFGKTRKQAINNLKDKAQCLIKKEDYLRLEDS